VGRGRLNHYEGMHKRKRGMKDLGNIIMMAVYITQALYRGGIEVRRVFSCRGGGSDITGKVALRGANFYKK